MSGNACVGVIPFTRACVIKCVGEPTHPQSLPTIHSIKFTKGEFKAVIDASTPIATSKFYWWHICHTFQIDIVVLNRHCKEYDSQRRTNLQTSARRRT